MSLKTWKKEFYPVDAKKVPKKKALEHSLRKWTGLLKGNLKKHGVELRLRLLVPIVMDSDDEMNIDDSTCALCFHYMLCDRCPILKQLGGYTCDDIGRDSPYMALQEKGDPKPMIKVLRKALKEEHGNDET